MAAAVRGRERWGAESQVSRHGVLRRQVRGSLGGSRALAWWTATEARQSHAHAHAPRPQHPHQGPVHSLLASPSGSAAHPCLLHLSAPAWAGMPCSLRASSRARSAPRARGYPQTGGPRRAAWALQPLWKSARGASKLRDQPGCMNHRCKLGAWGRDRMGTAGHRHPASGTAGG